MAFQSLFSWKKKTFSHVCVVDFLCCPFQRRKVHVRALCLFDSLHIFGFSLFFLSYYYYFPLLPIIHYATERNASGPFGRCRWRFEIWPGWTTTKREKKKETDMEYWRAENFTKGKINIKTNNRDVLLSTVTHTPETFLIPSIFPSHLTIKWFVSHFFFSQLINQNKIKK